MHAVFGLVENDAGGAFEYFFAHFYAVQAEGLVDPFADFGFAVVKGGQAVHEFDLRRAGGGHQLGADAVGAQQVDALLPDFRRLAHADPNIGVDKIDAGNGLLRVVGEQDARAAALGQRARACDYAVVRPQFFRCADAHVHAHQRACQQQGIAHIAAGVANVGIGGLGKGFAAVFAHGQQIGQALGGVEAVG